MGASALDRAALARMWEEVAAPGAAIQRLNIKRVPADALAFYRPFHCLPAEEWGIHILVGKLLKHADLLRESLGRLTTFNDETIMLCVLFEVFHHEFFHHLTESTATALEILQAQQGSTRPLYVPYLRTRLDGTHPHRPIEEALANAYAHNSFSFISKTKVGYINGLARLYQKAIEACWKLEPPGYRDAHHYIKGGHIHGGAQLLEVLLGDSSRKNSAPLEVVAERVFPRGHAAMFAKPDLPTYLIGTPSELERFYSLVPAPNEAYTQLFWARNTDKVDAFFKDQREEAKKMRRKTGQQNLPL